MEHVHFKRRQWIATGALWFVAALTACGSERSSSTTSMDPPRINDSDDTDPGNDAGSSLGSPDPRSALIPAAGCDDLRPIFEQRLASLLAEAIDNARRRMLNKVWYGCDDFTSPPTVDGGPDIDDDNGANYSDSDVADDYSTTNTQVAGVDEADFVKNDESYIYILADDKLQIIDAWPAHEARRIGELEIEGDPKKLYVYEDRGVIYSSLGYIESGNTIPHESAEDLRDSGLGDYEYEDRECTYGYDCEFTGDGKALKMSIVDLTDKTAPKVTREIIFSGAYLNSRRIDDIVHTMLVFPDPITVPGVPIWPESLLPYRDECWDNAEDVPFDEEQVNEAFDEIATNIESNVSEALTGDLSDFLPKVRDVRFLEGGTETYEGTLLGCDKLYLSQAGDGSSYLGLVSFDLPESSDIGGSLILSRPGAVYATADSLYVAVRHYSSEIEDWYFDDEKEISEATTVHKFALESNGTESTYRGSGLVGGRVLNQFSMDEYEGYLRIATTTGQVWQQHTRSTVSVLAEQSGALPIVGMVDGIAPTEDIRSARFDEELGFIVTFKKTDPLFVIDLAQPTKPMIKGELKIPGFSTYMHLMDDDHLLTIGYDADDQGSFAWFQGIQLQIINIADISDPRLIHKEVIGTRGSTSEAATNHLAFNYYPTRDLLALPMAVCEDSSGGGSYGMQMTFSGLYVYETTTGNGFSKLGGIPHEEPETEYSNESGCYNWWTDSNSKVKRSIFMEDFVYSIAKDKINISRIDDPSHPITSIDLVEK
ncbi:MAG: hypothetical protein GY847_38990 [Proteobacteria bacterium]|nr:hypothetical protein [Pseudomonadota bacterium]